jgi:hypothetical protein
MDLPKLGSWPFALLLAAGSFVLAAPAPAAEPAKPPNEAEAKSREIAVYTQEIIDAMDTDKNREVSKAEFLDFMAKEFDRLDVNHDGKLQKSEVLNKPIMGQQKTSVSHR